MAIDLAKARDAFENASDFTVGIEEEYALLDPVSLALTNRFEELNAEASPHFGTDVHGELISSEIELVTKPSSSFSLALGDLQGKRRALFELAKIQGIVLASTALHPFSPWQKQRIIQTPHYTRVENELRYVAWINNTFGLHVHVGVKGADRAVAVSDGVREYLPLLLAISANSPFLSGRYTYLHSTRTQRFTKSFPRCGIPEPFGNWRSYADYVDLLVQTGSIAEGTQIWWSVRPHLTFGTVEVRICDGQGPFWRSATLAALMTAVVALVTRHYDEGRPGAQTPSHLLSENFWRAIRYGMEGHFIDFKKRCEVSVKQLCQALLEELSSELDDLDLVPALQPLQRFIDEGNGAQQQIRAYESGTSIEEIWSLEVAASQAAELSAVPA